MKRLLSLLLCLLIPSLALAKTKDEPIPARYAPILAAWNASTTEEMYDHMLTYLGTVVNPGEEAHYKKYAKTSYSMPIRLGGTTKELLKDQKWGLAIVSSKEVDLHILEDKKRIRSYGYAPGSDSLLQRWLLPEKLRALMPTDFKRDFEVSIYDYDAAADDATLLIMSNKSKGESAIVQMLLDRRTPEQARSAEGISRVDYWTTEQLIANPEGWDVATLHDLHLPDDLEALDAAGMLLDLQQDGTLASRVPPELPADYLPLPAGYFSADGRMLALPLNSRDRAFTDDSMNALVINAKSAFITPALAFAVHLAKCVDWQWSKENFWERWKPTEDMLAYFELN